jgi:hypothetical protein
MTILRASNQWRKCRGINFSRGINFPRPLYIYALMSHYEYSIINYLVISTVITYCTEQLNLSFIHPHPH